MTDADEHLLDLRALPHLETLHHTNDTDRHLQKYRNAAHVTAIPSPSSLGNKYECTMDRELWRLTASQ